MFNKAGIFWLTNMVFFPLKERFQGICGGGLVKHDEFQIPEMESEKKHTQKSQIQKVIFHEQLIEKKNHHLYKHISSTLTPPENKRLKTRSLEGYIA